MFFRPVPVILKAAYKRPAPRGAGAQPDDRRNDTMPDLKIPEAQEELKTEQLPEQAPAQAPEETPKKEPWEAPNPKKKVKTAAEKKKLVKRVVAGVTAAAVLGGANMVRAHDVREAGQAARMADALKSVE